MPNAIRFIFFSLKSRGGVLVSLLVGDSWSDSSKIYIKLYENISKHLKPSQNISKYLEIPKNLKNILKSQNDKNIGIDGIIIRYIHTTYYMIERYNVNITDNII